MMARKTLAATYAPKRLASQGVVLPPELTKLLEQLAEHVHDAWAAARIAEGWTWGPQRDDVAKQHPGLVPYSDLTESEKEYDRATARTTLLGIFASGFEIRRSDGRTAGKLK